MRKKDKMVVKVGQVWSFRGRLSYTITKVIPGGCYGKKKDSMEMETYFGNLRPDGMPTWDVGPNEWFLVPNLSASVPEQPADPVVFPKVDKLLDFFKAVPKDHCPCNIPKDQCRYHNE